MERFWGLYRYWQQDWHCHKYHPSIFYIHFPAYNGITYYYLPGACILEEYEKVYMGS